MSKPCSSRLKSRPTRSPRTSGLEQAQRWNRKEAFLSGSLFFCCCCTLRDASKRSARTQNTSATDRSRVGICPAATSVLVLHYNVKTVAFFPHYPARTARCRAHNGRENASCTGTPDRPLRSAHPQVSSSEHARVFAQRVESFFPFRPLGNAASGRFHPVYSRN